MNARPCPGLRCKPCALAVAVAMLGGSPAAKAVSLELTELAGLAPGSQPLALSNRGQVVGSANVGGLSRAFSWTAAGGLLDLHFPAGTGSESRARGVNDGGTVVIDLGLPSGYAYALSWQGGVHSFLPNAWAAPRTAMTVSGINNAGQVVGLALEGGASTLSYLYRPTLGGSAAALPGSLGDTLYAAAINQDGAVTGSYVNGLVSGGFLWTPAAGTVHLPGLAGSAAPMAINDRQQLAGYRTLDGQARAFLWQADRGLVDLGTLAGESRALGLNSAGQVVGKSMADGRGGGWTGGFLYTEAGGMQDVNRLLTAGTVARVQSLAAINEAGQMVGQDSSGRAVLLTPRGELAWQATNGGSFNEGRLWEQGFAPSRFVDAKIQTAGAQRVTLAQDAEVNSLGLGSAAGGQATLVLQQGTVLNAGYGVTVRATGVLTGDGRVAGGVVNLGTVLADHLSLDGVLSNQGLIGVAAGTPGLLSARLDNQAAGQLRVGAGERLRVSGTQHANSGTIEVRGGELEFASGALLNEAAGRLLLNGGTLRVADGLVNRGSLQIGFNGAEVFGQLQQGEGGLTVLSGRSNTTFYDAVDIGAGSELRVAAGATGLFFGRVDQREGARFTGNGSKFYEGGLSIGASPGLGHDEGSVWFGAANLYLAEIGGLAPGTGHDQLTVEGELHFGGTLKLSAWGGFAVQAGQRFDLFDWGRSSGSFQSIDASGLALAPGLVLDTSRLYLDGSIGVSAVPEPASAGLLLAGLAGLWTGLRRRLDRIRSDRAVAHPPRLF